MIGDVLPYRLAERKFVNRYMTETLPKIIQFSFGALFDGIVCKPRHRRERVPAGPTPSGSGRIAARDHRRRHGARGDRSDCVSSGLLEERDIMIVNAKKKRSASNALTSLAGQTDHPHDGWRRLG
jgi:hypothetical protein